MVHKVLKKDRMEESRRAVFPLTDSHMMAFERLFEMDTVAFPIMGSCVFFVWQSSMGRLLDAGK